ncbi:MAG TPA: tetratricopeptide repeat protein [Polyangiaceae bacterium]|nr:tetratricopeptide repeat protein [Polyangiaceae bacterium]
MGAPPESDREAILGFDCLHRVAQSYLGPLWIAADARDGQATLRLLRRLTLPSGTTAEARAELAALGRRANELEHPNVLRVLEVVEHGEALGLVYEHAESEPLRSLQSWANLRGLSFPVGVALRIGADLLHGLSALHELGERDPDLCASGGLSPDSVLVSREGLTQLSDPLVASGAALLDGIGFNTAKLAYAAPEQVRPTKPPSAAADLFTCAAMLWELLASRRLLAGSRPAIERKLLDHNLPSLKSSLKAPHEVSDELIALVERALAADPAARPASAQQFAQELGACGHALASSADVAAFVGKLSGPRFDRRTAAIRSRSSGAISLDDVKLPGDAAQERVASTRREPASDVDTPRASAGGDTGAETPPVPPSVPRPAPSAPDASGAPMATRTAPFPLTPSTLRKAAEAKTRDVVPGQAEPVSEPFADAPATPSFAPAPVEPPRLGLAPAEGGRPALWDQMVAPSAPVSRPPTIPPLETNTLAGLGVAPLPGLDDPFSVLTPPGRGRAPAEEDPASIPSPLAPPASTDAPAPVDPFGVAALHAAAAPPAEGPLPFAHLLPKGKRSSSQFPSLAPEAQRLFALESPAAAVPVKPPGGIPAPYKIGIGLAAAAVVALGAWSLLGSRDSKVATIAEPAVATAEPPASEPPTPEPPPQAPSPSASSANVAPASMKTPEEAPDDVAKPEPNEPKPGADAPAPAQAADFAAPKLDDSQLVVLFALEGRGPAPSCAERLGDGASKYSGKDARRSQQQAKAAERELASGNAAAAHELACGAVAHFPKNVLAQRTLADVALQLGDPAQAKTAVDIALELAPKDKSLMALRGDVLALMGDIAGGRAMWLRTGTAKGSKATRTKRLVTAYRKAGDKALAASNWTDATTYFRRAVILTSGSFAPSLGLSEALLGLDRSRAGLVWAERAAQAFPKDSRIQVLFGDALYENGQGEKARAAWKTALDVQPSNRVAARRLREGKP